MVIKISKVEFKRRIIKYLYIVVICGLTTLSASCETLTFDSFLSAALNNSYKLKASKIDKDIAKAGVKEARAGYFPTLQGYATTERYNDLSDGTRQMTAVGNEILLNRDYYQDAAGFGLNYNLFDFGIRRKTLDIAKADNEQKEALLLKDIRDLKLDIVDLYGETLALYKVIEIKKQILILQNELLTINKRLRAAGENSEIDIVNSEINISEIEADIGEYNNGLAKRLTEISYYTNQTYTLNDIQIADFEENAENNIAPINIIVDDKPKHSILERQSAKLSIEKSAAKFDANFDIQNSYEAKTYDLEILKKQKEYEIQKKANFPKLYFDTRYSFYGSDDNHFFDSFSDIEQRSLSFRVSTSFTMFDGMKNINTVQKKKLEVEKLKVQKAQELAEMKKIYKQIELDAKYSALQSENNKKTLDLVNKNLEMLERLNKNGIIAKSECVKKKLELLNKKQRLEEIKIKNYIAEYKLRILDNE